MLIDRWGVPHGDVDSTYDAFVVQRFAAARDRLWRMDLWRRRGLGQMMRAELFRGGMYREWLAYGSDAKRVAEWFGAGAHVRVAPVNAMPEQLLPLEFKLLGYRAVPWSPEDGCASGTMG